MTAIWCRYRSSFRSNWRAWATLAALTGVALSLAVAAVSDARRTDSALPRAIEAGRGGDVTVSGNQTAMGRASALTYLDEVERLPQVTQSTRTSGVYLAEVSADGKIGERLSFGSAVGKLIDRPSPNGLELLRILDGRLPATDRADEVVVNPEFRRVTGWDVGDRMTSLRLFRLEDFDGEFNPGPTKGTPLDLTIVGIGRMPYELFDAAEERQPQVYLLPPFSHAYPDSTYYVSSILKVPGGDAAIGDLRSSVETVAARYAGAQVLLSVSRDGRDAVQESIRPQVTAIWLVAAVLGLAAALLSAQAVGRQISQHNRDTAALRALGMSPRDLGVLAMLHGVTIALGASAISVPLSLMSSLFTPLGSTRDIEPSPGLRFDPGATGVGVILIIVALSAASWVSAMRLARSSRPIVDGRATGGEPRRPSRLVAMLAHTGLPPTVVTGSRFALQAGRQTSTAPVRSVLSSITVAVATVGAALSFASSLDQLLHVPQRYGWNWDVEVSSVFGPVPDEAVEAIRQRPEVAAIAAFAYGNIRIGDQAVAAVSVDQLDGTVFPTMTEGRIPQGESDLVLGALTLRSIGRSIGDRVEVDTGHGSRTMTIVGTATFPSLGQTRTSNMGLGRGAATGGSVFKASDEPGAGIYNGVFVRLDPTLDRAAAIGSLRAFLAEQGCTDSGCFLTDGKPDRLAGYESLGPIWLPFALALGVMFAISLAHGIATTTRARRRELAILSALGLTRRQAGHVAIWQAATIVTTATIIGLPLGIIASNALWGAFSDRLGVRPHPSIPVLQLLVVSLAVAVSAVAVGLAYVPSTRRASASGLAGIAE